MELKLHHGGIKIPNPLEWQSMVLRDIEANLNLMVQLKEKLQALNITFSKHASN